VVFGYVTVVYRDVEHLMTTIFLPWFFLTPIFYTLDQLPGLEGKEWIADVLYYVNFVTPVVEAIRDPLFFGEWPDLGDILYSVAAGLGALVLGVIVARRIDDQVAATL
jgi:lipopolysaccharide transport system permease protein